MAVENGVQRVYYRHLDMFDFVIYLFVYLFSHLSYCEVSRHALSILVLATFEFSFEFSSRVIYVILF